MSVLSAGALTNSGEARGGLDLSRRGIFIWVCAIIFLNQLFGVVKGMPSASLEKLLPDLANVGFFQFMAWYAIFRLLASSDPIPVAQWRDFLIAVALCSLVFLPTTQMIWGTALGIGIFVWIFNGGDPKLRAAGIVLAALSVQEYWGHLFFNLFALSLLRAETAVVATMLQAAGAATIWQDNVITRPSGHGIVVFDACSSFHNLSLATLCWLTVSNLRNQDWHVRDFVTGCVAGVTMVLLNVARLCFMALDVSQFRYWHDGAGAEIFAIAASTAILLISVYGSRPARRMI